MNSSESTLLVAGAGGTLLRPRVALIHDWLLTRGGAERVLTEIAAVVKPDVVWTLLTDPGQDFSRELGAEVKTTFLQNLPGGRRLYRYLLPLLALAIEQIDLVDCELVVSSSFAVAKGVIVKPDQVHVCYCHSPMRYAWDQQAAYLKEHGLDHGLRLWLARLLLHHMRTWDARTANGVDVFIANSKFVARRIKKAYRREATVIYPPVDVTGFELCAASRENYYITASRLVPYKRIDLIVEAFARMPQRRLLVVGDGPELERIKVRAGRSRNVEMLGYVGQQELKRLLQGARGFVFAAEEDFGIAPVEAQACGTPVIAFGRGGVTESVVGLDAGGDADPTGVFFPEQSVPSLRAAIEVFERHEHRFSAASCRANAERFSASRFRIEFEVEIQRSIELFGAHWR